MNGPSKVCALVTTKSEVYTDPIGVENRLWPLWCPQRRFGIFFILVTSYSYCSKNSEAAETMLRCSKTYDTDLTPEKSLSLQVKDDEVFMLATLTIITTGLEAIWANRQVKKVTSLYTMRAQLECAVSIRRRSRNRKIREAWDIIQNILRNFF